MSTCEIPFKCSYIATHIIEVKDTAMAWGVGLRQEVLKSKRRKNKRNFYNRNRK